MFKIAGITQKAPMATSFLLLSSALVVLLSTTSCARYRVVGGTPQSPIQEQAPQNFGPDSGFQLSATPSSVSVGEVVSFELKPQCTGITTLFFGDGQSSSSLKTHTYQQAGTMKAYAECKDPSAQGKVRKSAEISVVVTNGGISEPDGGCPVSCW